MQVCKKFKIKLILSASFLAGTGFLAGKYHERLGFTERINILKRPGLPIFGTVSAGPRSERSSNRFFNFLNIFRLNFETIEAASPVPAVPVPESSVVRSSSNRVSEIMRYGFPSLDSVISYSDYVLSYDKRNRVAHWVFEHLTAESVRKNDEVDRSKCEFKEDTGIHHYFRSSNSDYKGSGYDRGHLAAAGNHKLSQKLVEDTFYLTNMAPQVGKGFNRGLWNKLEKHVRKLTRSYSNVYCCTGPLYLPRKESDGKMYIKYEVIGSNHVAVPTHFFKIIVSESKDGKLDMECYVMENAQFDDSTPIKNFQVPPEVVERASGLLFFDRLSRERLQSINGRKL